MGQHANWKAVWLALSGWLVMSVAFPAHAGLPIQHWQTRAGTPVYFVETHALPMLDVQVDFAAGSAYDPPGKAGLAGMTRSLLDGGVGQGSDALNEEQIADRLADVGAVLGASGDQDRSSVALRTLSARQERDAALAVLRLVLQQPQFPDAVFQRERSRAIAGLKDALTQPGALVNRQFMQTLYAGHPYGQLITTSSLEGLSNKDAIDFYRQFFTKKNARINLVGDVSRAEAEAIAESLSAGLPEGEAAPALPAVGKVAGGEFWQAFPSQQAHVLLGLRGVKRGDPDFFPLLVGNYLLGGGGFVSQLTKEVREKRGYAYSVYSYFLPMKAEGPFEIGLQTKVAQTAAALQVTRDTLNVFLRQPVSAAALAAAKANLVNGFVLKLDSNRKVLDNLAMLSFYDLPLNYFDQWTDKVQAVTAAQIQAAFARHVQAADLMTVVVGGETSPFSQKGQE